MNLFSATKLIGLRTKTSMGTEEGGVTPSVYSRKEPVHLTEREKQKLQVWSRMMPYRESFSWAIIPLFDNNIGSAAGGSASPSSPLAHSLSGASLHNGVSEPIVRVTLDGQPGYSSGNSVIVEVSNLNKVNESYTKDSLQDRMDASGVSLVLIGPGSVDQARAFSEQTNFKGEVYADPSYASYKALGLKPFGLRF